LERTGATLGQVLDAQQVFERCTADLLSESDTGPLAAALARHDPRPTADAAGRVQATLDLYADLAGHTSNLTLRCLGALGRLLVARAVSAVGSPGPTGAAWAPAHVVERHGQLLAAARDGDAGGVAETWQTDSEDCYRELAQVLEADRVIDMFA
jgi:hypothetical protein